MRSNACGMLFSTSSDLSEGSKLNSVLKAPFSPEGRNRPAGCLRPQALAG